MFTERRARHLAFAAVAYLLAAGGFLVMAAWLEAARLPLLGCAVGCGSFGIGQLTASARWAAGADGERRVARELRRLRRRGWLVLHDLPKDGGNVDHLVAGDGGMYTIETKLTALDDSSLAQARAHAAWASRRFGRPVIAVLCLARRPDRPHLRAGVWCMGVEHVARFLTSQGRKLRTNG